MTSSCLKINPSTFTKLVEVQQLLQVPNGQGGYDDVWHTILQPYCAIKQLSQREVVRSEQAESPASHRFTMRYQRATYSYLLNGASVPATLPSLWSVITAAGISVAVPQFTGATIDLNFTGSFTQFFHEIQIANSDFRTVQPDIALNLIVPVAFVAGDVDDVALRVVLQGLDSTGALIEEDANIVPAFVTNILQNISFSKVFTNPAIERARLILRLNRIAGSDPLNVTVRLGIIKQNQDVTGITTKHRLKMGNRYFNITRVNNLNEANAFLEVDATEGVPT